MTTDAIYRRFKVLYQEQSQRFFDPTVWAVGAMNDAIDFIDSELADVNPEAIGTLSTTLDYVVSTQELTLPVGFQEMVMVEITDRGGPPFPRLSPTQFRQRSGALSVPYSAGLYPGIGFGEPREYYIRAGSPGSTWIMGFIPIPNRSASGNVLAWYHGDRAEIATVDINTYPDVPAMLHASIARYMCVLAAMNDGLKVEYYQGLFNSTFENRKGQLIRGPDESQHEQIPIVDDYEVVW
jgi:hypothetical protein